MKNIFLFVASFLLALTSCMKENEGNEFVSYNKIQASFEEDIVSRLIVGKGNVLSWSADDSFEMFNDKGNSTNWKLDGVGGDEIGVFEGIVPEGTLIGAAFPATAFPKLEGNELTMTLPTELFYQADVCNLPMWASFSSLDETLSFKHLAALLKVDFTDIPQGYNSLIVTTDKAISGTFSADLSQAEPVLKPIGSGTNSVKVSFTAIEGENNDCLFYIPLPVGEYGFINVSVSDGTNTLSIADWGKRTIVRRKVYVASVSYRASDRTVPSDITKELDDMVEVTSNVTVDLKNIVDASKGNIIIPTEASKVALNFEQMPNTSEETPLAIVEESATDGAELTISLPIVQGVETYMEFNTPTTTVNVEGGNYQKIIARTAANTLVLGENTTVVDLVILAGNVVLDGGKVTGSITRDASNTDKITYVYVKTEGDLAGVTLGAGIEVVITSQDVDYLTFTAESEQTFQMTKAVETLEYSLDGILWTELGMSTVTFGGEKGTLRLRGKSAIGTAVSFDDAAQIVFGNASVPVAASGDIRTLIDYQNYESSQLNTSEVRFCKLFQDCTNLIMAPKLPTTILANYCYYKMLSGCTSLEVAPELPATTLAYDCYYKMFSGCTSLEVAPALPATTLAGSCYEYMFENCTALTKAPVLPATTLATGCYQNMFENCTALTKAPALPATVLSIQCYMSMFLGCTSLTETPALPATTLAGNCYRAMFYGCTSLTSVSELPATTLANYCYQLMFFKCTSLTFAPKLPATTLTLGCYQGMFEFCENLTEAPILSAPILTKYCYGMMFDGCKRLDKVTMLATDVSAPNALRYWLNDVALKGTFYKNSSITDVSAYGIPEGWVVEDF